MSREIKFRAWDGKKMYSPDELIQFGNEGITTGYFDPSGCPKYSDHKLMQYTGLKDRAGREIFEGDILRFLDGQDCSTESGFDWDEYMNIGAIRWSETEARYVISNLNMLDIDTFIDQIEETEVIGNIYENPDLLEHK